MLLLYYFHSCTRFTGTFWSFGFVGAGGESIEGRGALVVCMRRVCLVCDFSQMCCVLCLHI